MEGRILIIMHRLKLRGGLIPLKKQFARLQQIDHNEPITLDTHYEFLHHLQSALLLALQEQGRLNVIQYRYAAQALRQQGIERAKRMLNQGDSI